MTDEQNKPPPYLCHQELLTEDGENLSTDGHLILCLRPCEPRYSRRLRMAGAPTSTYKFCGAHKRLRSLYGPTDPRTMRPVEDRKRKEKE